jgi:hypothetical protein
MYSLKSVLYNNNIPPRAVNRQQDSISISADELLVQLVEARNRITELEQTIRQSNTHCVNYDYHEECEELRIQVGALQATNLVLMGEGKPVLVTTTCGYTYYTARSNRGNARDWSRKQV